MAERDVRFRWTITAVVVLTAVVLVAPFTVAGAPTRLRDRHSQPSAAFAVFHSPSQESGERSAAPAVGTVVVTTSGKLYHDSRCPFIHGTPAVESVAAAIAQGYSPCPRCLGSLRKAVRTARALY